MSVNHLRRTAHYVASNVQRLRRAPSPRYTLSAFAAASLTGYTLGVFAPPSTQPKSTLATLAQAQKDHRAWTADPTPVLERELETLPMLQNLRATQDDEEWFEVRPHLQLSESRRANHLTATALKSPEKLALSPLVRAKKDNSESYVFLHVGSGVCGHEGLIHGGLIATILDEALARTAVLNLPEKVGVTANLSINYRAPTKANQFIVVHTQLVEHKGRKAVCVGQLIDASGKLLVEAKGTFVQPKYAASLKFPGGSPHGTFTPQAQP